MKLKYVRATGIRKSACLLLLAYLVAFSTANAFAENTLFGLAIAEERKARDVGWKDVNAVLDMTLRNSRGDESLRKMNISTLEVLDDGDKSLIVFEEPRDIRGTALLTYSHSLTPDEQWLYLPAVKRVKLIASRNKSGPFVGSEFSYEDMTSYEVEKFKYQLIKEEAFEGEPCFVVEQIPMDEFSGYKKQHVWIDQAHYRVLKTEFYDRKDALLKTLLLKDYQLYLDKYWRPHTLHMQNHQNRNSTTLRIGDYNFQSGLSENDFTRNSLMRAR